ncbi:MAG: OapB/ArvB family protein [Nanobdellota archaeon]
MAKSGDKHLGKIKGFSIQFLPYSEIRDLNSNERIRKILTIVLGNNILLLQGRLRAEEEARLIGDTMAMIGHVKDFKGIELAVIGGNGDMSMLDRMRGQIIKALSRGDIGAVTIIGPATIVKEIKRNPKKIELLLSK